MVAVDPSEPGEWFEPAYLDQPRAGAARVSLGEGDVKTQDFRVSRSGLRLFRGRAWKTSADV